MTPFPSPGWASKPLLEFPHFIFALYDDNFDINDNYHQLNLMKLRVICGTMYR